MNCSLPEDLNEFETDFHSLLRSHRAKFLSLIKDDDFFPGQIPLLATINGNNGCTQKEICNVIMFKPASVTDALKRMEKSGLIERHKNKADLRSVRVFITDLGKDKLRDAVKISHQMEKICFKGFNKEEEDKFKTLLKKMIENLDNKGAE